MGVPSFIGVNTMFPEKPGPRSKRSGVEHEEERAWVSFYCRVRADVAIATEVLAQLEADPQSKRAHLALYLCCKESLRMHKVRQSRNKRIGHFVRWFCRGLFIAPLQNMRRALHQGGDIAVECLPEPAMEPAVAQVRQLTRESEFAQAASGLGQLATTEPATKPSRASKARSAAIAA